MFILKIFFFFLINEKKILHTVRFELTRIASPDLKSGPLDHSGMYASLTVNSKKQNH